MAGVVSACIKDLIQNMNLGIPVFWKEDLVPIMGEANMIQELPQAFNDVPEAQKIWKKSR